MSSLLLNWADPEASRKEGTYRGDGLRGVLAVRAVARAAVPVSPCVVGTNLGNNHTHRGEQGALLQLFAAVACPLTWVTCWRIPTTVHCKWPVFSVRAHSRHVPFDKETGRVSRPSYLVPFTCLLRQISVHVSVLDVSAPHRHLGCPCQSVSASASASIGQCRGLLLDPLSPSWPLHL